MGLIPSPKKCFITDELTKDLHRSSPLIEYTVSFFGSGYMFRFEPGHENSKFVNDNLLILRGLLLNNQFPDLQKTILNNNVLETLIKDSWIPKSPKEKLDNLLLKLSEYQKYDGDLVRAVEIGDPQKFRIKLFFKAHDEFDFYFNALKSYGYLTTIKTNKNGIYSIQDYSIPIEGIKYLSEIEKEGPLSNSCFIAISFDKSLRESRDAIKQAVIQTGFKPIVIDEQNQESDETINDAIISQIKKSRFCISDFTLHRNGVYFEAGYSLGRGIKVIYCCAKSDFNNAHFDINHYQHIIYENPEDLRQKLIDKIEAWIK
jgi:hypothetical protein